MNFIKNWFAKHNLTSHSIVVALLFFAGLYGENDAVRGVVNAFLQEHQKLSALFTVLLGAYMKYSHGHKTNQ